MTFVLFLFFVGSGAAALIYEIVWFQLLELFIGSSAVSIGVLLGTFMGGMCLGSVLLSRVVARRRHPLRVYAALELGIGAFGLLLLFVMPVIGRIYTEWGGEGIAGFLLRGLVAGICLLPPTLVMGATLPAVSRWVETTPAGVSKLGLFYSGNIAGGVFGSLLAAFYLLRAKTRERDGDVHRRDRLHLLAHSGGLSHRSGDRQRPRVDAVDRDQAPRRPRLVSDAARRGNRVDGA